jgi:quinolinate synthase
VLAEADCAGSTAQMSHYIKEHNPQKILLVTECSMSDNLAASHPDVEFVRPCNLCPHMKKITLRSIRHALETMSVEVKVDPAVSERARQAIERMLAV